METFCIRSTKRRFRGHRGFKGILGKALVVLAVVVLGAQIVYEAVQPRPIYALGVDGCTPHAVLGENKNLNFVCDSNTYTVGGTYTDNLGSTTIAAVYDVPANSSYSAKPGWTNNSNITAANFSSSFINFHPTSTAYWFYHDKYIALITNAGKLYTSDVTDMSGMFSYAGYSATSWSVDLSGWDTGNVTDMSSMFKNIGGGAGSVVLVGLDDWDTGNVTTMSSMFAGAAQRGTSLTIGDLSNWDTKNVTTMSSMFSEACEYCNTNITVGNLGNWNTGKVTDMSSMFYMFGGASFSWYIGDLSGWDTGNVTNMSNMFNKSGGQASNWSVGNLKNWNTSNVTNMSGMFGDIGNTYTGHTAIIELNLSGWDTSKVTNMSNMFYNATLSKIIVGSGWNISAVTNSDKMFGQYADDPQSAISSGYGTYLVGGNGTAYSASNPTDKTYARIDNDNQAGYLTGTIYSVALDNQSATTAGTGSIYEQYDTRFHLDEAKTKPMSSSANSITVPEKKKVQAYYDMGTTGITSPTSPVDVIKYTFGGYYTATNGGGTQYINANGYITSSADASNFTDDTGTLYAKWTQTGDGSLTLPQLAKEGLICKWLKGSTSGEQYDGGETVTGITTDTTFYAVCYAEDMDVTFNQNYYGAPNPTTIEQTYGENYDLPEDPSRTGYTFDGWYTETSGGTKVTAQTPVTAAGDHTLYAHWTAKTYTVTFNQNYTGAPTATTIEETFDSNYTLPTEPTRTGYTFDGWFTAASGGTQVTASTQMTTAENRTLYAHWTVKTFTVTFNQNYTGAPEGTTIGETFDSNYTLPTAPTRTGYTFDGWFTDASEGTEVTTSTKVMTANNHTLYAHWAAKTYTVTFDQNYDGAPAATSVTETYDASYSLPTAPTRTGYTFDGWFTDASEGTEVITSTKVTTANNHTLYAHWAAKSYSVALDNQSATTAGTGSIYEQYDTRFYLDEAKTKPMSSSANPITVPEKKKVQAFYDMGTTGIATPTSPVDVIKYAFGGYYTATNGEGTQYINANGYITSSASASNFTDDNGKLYAKWTQTGDGSLTLPSLSKTGYTCKWAKGSTSGDQYDGGATVTGITTDTTFYAVCTPNVYQVTFNQNYTGAPEGTTIGETFDSNYTLPESNPTRTGYTFDGWFTETSAGTEVTTSTKVATANDHTLYAHWTAKSYTVTFNQNYDGAPAATTQSETYGSNYVLPTDPTRAGYNFSGWWTAAEGGTLVTAQTTVTTAENHTLYAHWASSTPVTYNLTYDMNGGDGEIADQSCTTTLGHCSQTVSSTVPTRTGYNFLGWSLDRTATTATYGGGDTIELSAASGTTLYAIWAIKSYTVTYSRNDGQTPSTYATKTIAYNSHYTLPESNPTRTGYTFQGWWTAATGGTQVTATTTMNTPSNHTIYAHWTANTYTVAFNANGGTGGQTQSVTATYDQAMPTISTTAPTRTDYRFLGWYDNANYAQGTKYYNSDGSSARTYDKTANMTLYAAWEALPVYTYTLQYDLNGGTGEFDDQTCDTTGTSCRWTIINTTPTRENYNFLGWATSSNATEAEYAPEDSFTAGNTTLYAVWKYKGSGGINWPEETSEYVVGEDEPLVLRIDYLLDEFQSLSIDDVVLEENVHYTLKSGSTIISIKSAYLDTLSTGNHAIVANFTDDRNVTTTFSVAKQESTDDKTDGEAQESGTVTTPDTGDNSFDNSFAILSITVVPIVGVLVLVYRVWKNKTRRRVKFEGE